MWGVAAGLWCVACRVAVQVAAGIPRKQRSDAKRKRPQIITAKSLVTVTASKTTVEAETRAGLRYPSPTHPPPSPFR